MVTQVENEPLHSAAKSDWVKRLFPAHDLGTADWVLGVATLVGCFFLFLHGDLQWIGFCSLSYLSGNALEFYENAARASDSVGFPIACSYPPSTYAIFASWLYPLKALGLTFNAETFAATRDVMPYLGAVPTFETYWLKTLTTVAYIASGVVFYRIARMYWHNDEWSKYATVAWLTMPLAVFSQLIFSQVDIFYVLWMLLGILMFLKGRLYLGALYFGLSITFKYFPAFVFLPLLFLFEKRVARIAVCILVFITPLAFIELVYHRSAEYLTLVHGFDLVNRVYRVSLDLGGWRIYPLFTAFAVLCGVAYFTDRERDMQLRTAAYLWLIASIMPFVFITWHPQWLIFVAPAIALTSVLSHRFGTHATLDLFGMFLFIAAVSLAFPVSVDATLFRAAWLGISFDYSFLMGQLFEWFGAHSSNVFLSGFTGYLILQVVLKFKHILIDASSSAPAGTVHYGNMRRYFYVGLLIFVLPAAFAMLRDKLNNEYVVSNLWADLVQDGRALEQTFIAPGNSLSWVSIPLTIADRPYNSDVILEIIDTHGTPIANVSRRVAELKDSGWNRFSVQSAFLKKGEVYRVRLTSTNAGISWLANAGDRYQGGQAIVDGIVHESEDFLFRIGFSR